MKFKVICPNEIRYVPVISRSTPFDYHDVNLGNIRFDAAIGKSYLNGMVVLVGMAEKGGDARVQSIVVGHCPF